MICIRVAEQQLQLRLFHITQQCDEYPGGMRNSERIQKFRIQNSEIQNSEIQNEKFSIVGGFMQMVRITLTKCRLGLKLALRESYLHTSN